MSNLRKRLRPHSEPHTGALNDILFILLFFFLIVSTLANPNVVKVNNPKGAKDTKARQSIVVSINKDQQVFIGQKQVELSNVDTLLKEEVLRHRSVIDTPFVVINADTIAYYGEVFRIMQSAKRAGAKVVANVK
jgi:biopolymer transport protein ExbD